MLSTIIHLCAFQYGMLYGIEPNLIKAIAKVESNNKPHAISPDGNDIGLMQVRKMYVRETRDQLLDTCTSIKVATRILKFNKDYCKHKKDHTYIVCYNVGVAGGNKINHPKKFVYYKKVMKNLRGGNL